jgi:hypothetical protein
MKKKELKFELHIPFEIYYSKTRYIIQSLRNVNITYKPIKSELKRVKVMKITITSMKKLKKLQHIVNTLKLPIFTVNLDFSY